MDLHHVLKATHLGDQASIMKTLSNWELGFLPSLNKAMIAHVCRHGGQLIIALLTRHLVVIQGRPNKQIKILHSL